MRNIDDFPKKIVENREMIEANLIFCLYKEPDLFSDYMEDINAEKDFVTEDGRFYYALGCEMYRLGYKSFNDASIYSYAEGKDTIKNGYERRGGFKTISEIMRILDTDNVETYYDELVKNNILMGLFEKGFNVVDDIAKLNKMTSNQVYDWYDYQLNNVFLNRCGGVNIEDLDIDDEFIKSCDEGEELGLSYGHYAPIMNYHTMGIHKSNVQIFGGFSGTGKSSFCVHTYIMSILEQGEKVAIIANEMNKKAWQHIFLATILSRKLNYYKLPRKKVKTGNFNEEQREILKKAQEYYNEHYAGRIKFVKIFDYSIEDVKKTIRKLHKRGFNYYLYDTFKSQDASAANVTGQLIEDSKQLLQIAEKLDVSITITMQLAIYMESTRYLSSSCLSNAKGVKEVVSELILTRPVWEDEFDGEKYDIKPYRFKKDTSGKFTSVKEYITLDPNKKYNLMFLDKSRNDEGDIVLVYQFDGAWNVWREIGYCTPKHQR